LHLAQVVRDFRPAMHHGKALLRECKRLLFDRGNILWTSGLKLTFKAGGGGGGGGGRVEAGERVGGGVGGGGGGGGGGWVLRCVGGWGRGGGGGCRLFGAIVKGRVFRIADKKNEVLRKLACGGGIPHLGIAELRPKRLLAVVLQSFLESGWSSLFSRHECFG